MTAKWDVVGTVAVVAAAAMVAGAAVHREFARPAAPAPRQVYGPPSFDSGWRSAIAKGIRVGDAHAPIQVIEFADLECPYCKRFHTALEAVRKSRASEVSFVFVHFPLQQHRFARPAARALECARAQGAFEEFVNAVFEKQDSLGLKPWATYARDAGVLDTARFLRCQSDNSKVPAIEDGLAEGERIGVRSTPTVIINGWRYSIPPYDSLPAIFSRLLRGESPVTRR